MKTGMFVSRIKPVSFNPKKKNNNNNNNNNNNKKKTLNMTERSAAKDKGAQISMHNP